MAATLDFPDYLPLPLLYRWKCMSVHRDPSPDCWALMSACISPVQTASPTICGWQPFLRALAEVAKLTQEALMITLFQPIMVHSTNHLSDFLSHSFLSLPGSLWVQVFHLLFLENPQISLASNPVLNPVNPVNLFPVPSSSDTPSNSCSEAVEALHSPQPSLLDQSLWDHQLNLFVVGSSLS